MNLNERIAALVKLGDWLNKPENNFELELLYEKAEGDNKWFSIQNSKFTLEHISNYFLRKDILEQWTNTYPTIENNPKAKNVGLILAGNIPAVGFHDILCSFITGNISIIKYSDKDKIILPFLIQKLVELEPAANNYFHKVERIENIDKLIATGSDNSSRYFDYYFSKFDHIIRSNRNSVAIIHGDETSADLSKLAEDIFRYYGLGCRSVSKIYVPKTFDLEFFMQEMDKMSDELLSNSKYKNNFDYNRSVYLLNGTKHWCNDSLIIIEDPSLLSRISVLHFEFYDNTEALINQILNIKDRIQCIVSNKYISELNTIPLGESQNPEISEYADGVDTIEFLLK